MFPGAFLTTSGQDRGETMPQYRHSKHSRFLLAEFEKERKKSVSFALLTFIVLMIATISCAGAVSSFNSIIGIKSDYDTSKKAYVISDQLVQPNACSTFISEHWDFVPNVSPYDAIVKTPSGFDSLYRNMPHAENVSITDSWRGWYDFENNSKWYSTEGPISYKTYSIDGNQTHSVAYINSFVCDPSVDALYLSFYHVNGSARIYCNGEYVGVIGEMTPYFNTHAFADYCMLVPKDGRIDLTVVVSCATKVTNPGIISYPILQNRASVNLRTAFMGGHFSVMFLLFAIGIFAGSYLIASNFKDNTLIVSFIIAFTSIFMYYLVDCRFISVNSHYRAILRFMLIVISAVSAYAINTCILRYGRTRKSHIKFLRIDHHLVLITGILLFGTYIFFDIVFGLIAPDFAAIGFGLMVITGNILKDILLYRHRNPNQLLIAMSVSFVFFVLYLSVLLGGTAVYMLPTYSILYILFVLAVEIIFVSRYINQRRMLVRDSDNLKRQIREKTQYISEINRDLMDTNKKLMQGEQARKNVMSNVSHDLRTPITAIRGYAELMLSSGDRLSAEQREGYLTNIVRRSEQMERIVSDIMELTRMEASDSEFTFSDVSLCEMLDEVTMMYSMDLEGTKKRITLDIPEDDSLIDKGDPRKLSRVFENLVSNAINYTGEEALIAIKAWRTGTDQPIDKQQIHVTVSDNGIGIPEDSLPRIFDRFYRAKNSGINIKGTGLGLAIVKLICDKHSAAITVKSKIGVGTTFEVVFSATY